VMPLKTDLEQYCHGIFHQAWSERNGTVVPTDTSVTAGTDAVLIDAAVLYADLADSTVMVDKHSARFCAEVYKTFLYCSARIIRSLAGEITAYDGDRVMAVFIGEGKETRAVKAALQINWTMINVVQPQLKLVYKTTDFVLKHVVGIDTSSLFVAKTGIRGNNDLVWVGRAANYAAKLAALPESRATYITAEVYNNMDRSATFGGNPAENMWKPYKWNTFDDRTIYGSTWHWRVD